MTTEEVVDTEVIRAHPWRTVIPRYVVDAVCEVPHGTSDFEEYLERVGGVRKLAYFKRVEQFKLPMRAPWRKAA